MSVCAALICVWLRAYMCVATSECAALICVWLYVCGYEYMCAAALICVWLRVCVPRLYVWLRLHECVCREYMCVAMRCVYMHLGNGNFFNYYAFTNIHVHLHITFRYTNVCLRIVHLSDGDIFSHRTLLEHFNCDTNSSLHTRTQTHANTHAQTHT